MKNGNRFEQPSRRKGGRHDDNRSATKRKARRRGARRRRCSGPQYSGRGPPIGGHRDPHLGILHQSWRWVMLLKFSTHRTRVFPRSTAMMRADPHCSTTLRVSRLSRGRIAASSSSRLWYRLPIDFFRYLCQGIMTRLKYHRYLR